MNDEQADPWRNDWLASESSEPVNADSSDVDPYADDLLDDEFERAAGAAAPSAPARRFCRVCGTVVDEFTGICPRCEPAPGELSMEPMPAATPPSIGSALGLYFAVLGTILASGIAIMNGAEEAKSTCVVSVIMSVVVGIWCISSWRTVWPSLKTVPEVKWFAIAAAGGGVTFLIAHGMVTLLAKALNVPMLEEVRPMMDGGLSLPIIFLLLSVQPPVFEELAFRGIIQPAMMHYMSVRDAIIVSALLFMVLHLMPLSFPHLFIIGLALGFLRHRTGSLYPCILLHFVHNTLVLVTDLM